MTELLLSKLLPPRLKSGILTRPRLMRLFAGLGERKLTSLTAPAGYGKTVLMLQAATAAGRPLIWYQLDAYDNDPAVFLRYLMAGIERRLPGFGTQVRQAIESGGIEGRLRLLVTAIVNELSQHADVPLLIAFDDYHEITEPPVHSFLQDFLEHLPAHVHVIIASRTAPSLKLSRLKTAGEILTVGVDELRFTGEELQLFLAEKASRLSDEARGFLEQKVNGWPVAVKLVADSGPGDSSSLQLSGSAAEIYEYLAAEVLVRQPDGVREFLQRSAVLDIITAEDCNALLKRDDSRQMLALLEKQNLFLIPLAGAQKSYRYHQLFREFLLERLGAERHLWQREAGLLARSRGDLSAAVEYFRLAGAERELKDTLKEVIRQAFGQGRWQTVARWLEPLAPEVLAADPWLALYKAKVEMYRGRWNEAESWVHRAAELFAANGEQAGLTESQLLQARLLRCGGRYAESLALLEQAMRQIPREEIAHRFDLIMEKALCLLIAGQADAAETVLTTALASAGQKSDNYVMAHLLEGLGNVYCIQGKYSQAMQTYQKAAEIVPERVLPSYYMQDLVCMIYLEWGEVEQALDYAKRNVAIKESFGLTETLPSAYHQLAAIYCEQEEWKLAEKYWTQAISLIQDNNGERLHYVFILILLADCLCLQGRWTEARLKAEEALAEARPQGGIALAVCRAVAAVIFLQIGDLREGKMLLAAATADFEQMDYKRGRGFVYTFHSLVCYNEGNMAVAGEWAAKAFGMLAGINYQQIFLGPRSLMLQPVLKLALENGVEVAFAQRILARQGERALPLLACLAGHADAEVRRRIIAPLAEIGGSGAKETLRRLTEDPDGEVRQLARLAAQRLGIAPSGVNYPDPPVMPLEIATLGVFRVFFRGAEIGKTNWRTAKTRDLLAYLIHQGEPVSKDRILEDLWPDTDPHSAVSIFRTTLYYLRKTLQSANCPDVVDYNNKQCQLRAGSFSSDRQRFQELVAAASRSDTAVAEAVALFEQAVALYRGSYLTDMDYSWVVSHQENVKNLYIEARMRLAQYYLEKRKYTKSIAHLQVIVEYDPFAEEAHALLMTAYARQGNRQAVKIHYDRLESVLKKELGLAPSQAISDLYLRLIK